MPLSRQRGKITHIESDKSRKMFNYLAKAYIYGLMEGFNPYGLVLGLYFVIYLAFVGRTFFNVIMNGFIFLVSIAIFYGFMAAGIFDLLILRQEIINIFQYVCLCVGCLYLIFGLLNLYDWSRLRKMSDTSRLLVGVPSFLRVGGVSRDRAPEVLKHFQQAVIIFVGHLLGWLLVLSQTIWPVDTYIYRLFFIFLSEGLHRFSTLFFGFYGLGYVFFLTLIWLGVCWVSQNKRGQLTRDNRFLSFFKIITSALFISVGIGVIYIFIMQIS